MSWSLASIFLVYLNLLMHLTPPLPDNAAVCSASCAHCVLCPELCLTNTEGVRSAGKNREKKAKAKKRKLIQPPHLMIGKLQYNTFFQFNTALNLLKL